HLGVVTVHAQDFVMADIPGLIEGAADGAGLGHRFLGHIERCALLLHLIDATSENVVADYHTIRAELAAYDGLAGGLGGELGEGLENRQCLIALTKSDAISIEEQEAQRERIKEVCGVAPLVISAVAGSGLDGLATHLVSMLESGKEGMA
ncbi:MAG: GTPase ObgE, partial [Alphaproteobacteria bacterium]|nr:GTPase ObgE [Alphaproteobacteria bacterium]